MAKLKMLKTTILAQASTRIEAALLNLNAENKATNSVDLTIATIPKGEKVTLELTATNLKARQFGSWSDTASMPVTKLVQDLRASLGSGASNQSKIHQSKKYGGA